jgi:hypothetical protein
VDCGVALVRQWSGVGEAVESIGSGVSLRRQWSGYSAAAEWSYCGCVGAAVELCGSGVS